MKLSLRLSQWLPCLAFGLASLVSAVTAQVAPVLTPLDPPDWIVGGEVDYQIQYTGTATRFSQGGLPRGLLLDPRTGRITGRPEVADRYRIVITAFNGNLASTPLVVQWLVQPLPAGTAGTYQALMDRNSWYNGGYGGSLRLTVTSTGAYTGVITRGQHRDSVSGRLLVIPGGQVSPSGSFLVHRRSPYTPLQVQFTLPLNTGAIVGTLRETAGTVIQISGYRSLTSAGTLAGQWNTAFEVPESLVGNATYPQGAGWAIQRISASATISWTLRLADGSAATASTGLGSSGQTGLHLMLYNNAGSLQGFQIYDPVLGLTTGSLGWMKSPFYSRSYASGFPLHQLTAMGSRYAPPARGSMIFGLTPGATNSRLIFTEGGLASSYTFVFGVLAGNRLSLPTFASGGNPYRLTLNADYTQGLVSGSGTAMDAVEGNPANARIGTLSAILIPGRSQAVGHFLLPTSRSSTAPILSGKVLGEQNSTLD